MKNDNPLPVLVWLVLLPPLDMAFHWWALPFVAPIAAHPYISTAVFIGVISIGAAIACCIGKIDSCAARLACIVALGTAILSVFRGTTIYPILIGSIFFSLQLITWVLTRPDA